MAFDRVARISIKPAIPDVSGQPRFFPIRSIMCCGLEVFYKWHSQVSSSHGQRLLRFELTDLTCQNERGFIISENQLDAFRLLKQYIWDMFWCESNIRGALQFFTVAVEPYLPGSNSTSHDDGRSSTIPISRTTTKTARPVGSTSNTEPPTPLPDNKLPTILSGPYMPRTSAEKITLQMVSIYAAYYLVSSTLLIQSRLLNGQMQNCSTKK